MEHLKLFGLLFIFIGFNLTAQTGKFAQLSSKEINLKSYEKDSSAHAVVLYEKGDNYFEAKNNRIWLIKKYHVKIKLFDKMAFDEGTVKIPLYRNGKVQEIMEELQAVTHIGNDQHRVWSKEVFTNDLSENRYEKSFTFPKLVPGCIIEYSYKIRSPFFFNLTGWEFQSKIPKIYSEYNAKIPGNYVYNRSLIGKLKLDVNEADIKKHCFHIEGFSNDADCEVLKYAMNDVPAFKTEKEFMLSEKNYISRIEFELSVHNKLDGTTDRYTKSWKDVDKEFRNDKDIGRQLTKKGFFEKNVPDLLLTQGNELKRAQNIYKFIRNHFVWNGKYGVYGKARVKEAFENGTGSASEINMSLINLLNAAGIKTNLMLTSTRDFPLPKRIHPVLSDFNYCIAKVEIDNQIFLLDATDKFLPFGMLPFRCLNHYGRVMDFKNESYWYDIKPQVKSINQVRAMLSFDMEKDKAKGIIDMVSTGYNAVSTYKNLKEKSEQAHLDELENKIGGDYRIDDYQFLEKHSDEGKTIERFSFEIENVLTNDVIYLNPFIITFFKENPFLLDSRNYPVDFGYPREFKYNLALTLPEGYTVLDLPKEKAIKMGDNIITVRYANNQANNQIGISFNLNLNESLIMAEDYGALKNVFKDITDIQNNSLIVLRKESKETTGK